MTVFTGLSVGGFKPFDDLQRAEIRPLTLIFGSNSSGKSSLMHALLYAKAIQDGDLDPYEVSIGDEVIELGGFSRLLHRRRSGRSITLGLEFLPTAEPASQGDPGRPYNPPQSGSADHVMDLIEAQLDPVDVQMSLASHQQLPEQAASWLGTPASLPVVRRWSLHLGGSEFLTCLVGAKTVTVERVNLSDPLVGMIAQAYAEALQTASSETGYAVEPGDIAQVPDLVKRALGSSAIDLNLELRGFRMKIPAADVEFYENEYAGSSEGPSLQRNSDGTYRILTGITIAEGIPVVLAGLIERLSSGVEKVLSGIRYLGPIRTHPTLSASYSTRRGDAARSPHDAWEVLRVDRDARERVNGWLLSQDRLHTAYAYTVRDFVSVDDVANHLDPEKASDWQSLTAALDRPEIEKLQQIVLLDTEAGVAVSQREVGVGLSQVLPVLVHSYANDHKLVCIEQPELHLHPALQAELADVFIECAVGKRHNTFILETHSEHLILRVLRRIRETYEDRVPEGGARLKAEQVSILYVERDRTSSIIRSMPINSRGEFLKAWPGGFFEEGLREVFA